MLFIYTLPLNSSEGLKFIILYIKQNFGMSATRLCKYIIFFCIFKETVAVLYGNTYYETPCTSRTLHAGFLGLVSRLLEVSSNSILKALKHLGNEKCMEFT